LWQGKRKIKPLVSPIFLSQTYKMSSEMLWVQQNKTPTPLIDLVPFEGCTYVAQLLAVIRHRPQLAIPKDSPITLYHLVDGQEVTIDVRDSPLSLVAGNSRATPLIVR
jgi:hypothetical protein